MSRTRADKGAAGEDIAVQYLQKLGYQILHRNLRLSRYEIDIVCRDGAVTVFVEVKRSLSAKFGHPATWITERKQEHLRMAAQMYIDKYGVSGADIRFDAVTITGGIIEHYKHAF
jgi:putative endonuclease